MQGGAYGIVMICVDTATTHMVITLMPTITMHPVSTFPTQPPNLNLHHTPITPGHHHPHPPSPSHTLTLTHHHPPPPSPSPPQAGMASPLTQGLPPDAFVRPGDIRLGSTVRVYGRDLVVYDCDEHTRAWLQVCVVGVLCTRKRHACVQGKGMCARYMHATFFPRPKFTTPTHQEHLGYTPVELQHVPAPIITPRVIPPSPPPHMGFGSDADSMQNCLSLQPKPPKK